MRELRKLEIEFKEEQVHLANVASLRKKKNKETKNEKLNTNSGDEGDNDAKSDKPKTRTNKINDPKNL